MQVERTGGSAAIDSFQRTLPARALRPFFEARSVVVVGASANQLRNPGKPLYYLTRYGYSGRLYAVNPNHSEIFGCKSYPSVADLPEAPELAAVMVPVKLVPEAIRQCGEHGIRHAVVFANGFADSGNFALQDELLDAARQFGIRLLGPNCLGVVNVGNGLTATFSTYLLRKMFKRGPIGLLTQSGAVGNAILLTFQDMGIGISRWVATGNEADIGIMDFAEYVVEEPDCKILAFFVESVRDGWRWPAVARRARELGKPIIALKAGMGMRSRRAATSHSGRMVGSYGVWREVAAEHGIVAVHTMEEFCDAAYALSTVRRLPDGDLGVFCGSGGIGVLISDECERTGVRLAEISSETRSQLRNILPPGAGLENPVDPTPVTDAVYFRGAECLLGDANVRALLIIVTSLVRDYEETMRVVQHLNELAASEGKLVAVSYFSPADRLPREKEEALSSEGVIILPDPLRTVRGLAALSAAYSILSGKEKPSERQAAAPDHRAVSTDSVGLGWEDLGPLMARYGVGAEAPLAAGSADDAARLLKDLGTPIVLKLDDPNIAHKTEAGLVHMNISSAAEARRAYSELAEKATTDAARVIAQRQLRGGVEVLVGCTIDPEFGRIVSVGAGGTLAELLKDVRSALCPVDAAGARRLLERTRIHPLLTGFRGGRKHDMAALAEMIARVSRLFVENPELAELEMNPVVVMAEGQGAYAVDLLGVRRLPSGGRRA